ncbi:hypothetical protein F511_27056 [Dorcoceras hygrometricum]|uniref:Uncharacterized protein n=1 Tax=Dorcoceras hygrometricum TaxID=472368 RepID=A0A2Z7D0Q1_9LAMI|nr:hypothetical protein F511_27056 [Dorcoceras hygrometricum]
MKFLLIIRRSASLRDEKYRFLVKSTLVKVTVAPAGGIGSSRYGDISVTHEDLLALVRIEVAAGRHRALGNQAGQSGSSAGRSPQP